jgi:hypothetical protein
MGLETGWCLEDWNTAYGFLRRGSQLETTHPAGTLERRWPYFQPEQRTQRRQIFLGFHQSLAMSGVNQLPPFRDRC